MKESEGTYVDALPSGRETKPSLSVGHKCGSPLRGERGRWGRKRNSSVVTPNGLTSSGDQGHRRSRVERTALTGCAEKGNFPLRSSSYKPTSPEKQQESIRQTSRGTVCTFLSSPPPNHWGRSNQESLNDPPCQEHLGGDVMTTCYVRSGQVLEQPEVVRLNLRKPE